MQLLVLVSRDEDCALQRQMTVFIFSLMIRQTLVAFWVPPPVASPLAPHRGQIAKALSTHPDYYDIAGQNGSPVDYNLWKHMAGQNEYILAKGQSTNEKVQKSKKKIQIKLPIMP